MYAEKKYIIFANEYTSTSIIVNIRVEQIIEKCLYIVTDQIKILDIFFDNLLWTATLSFRIAKILIHVSLAEKTVETTEILDFSPKINFC